MKDHLKIPDGMEGYVSDYKANLFEIAFLPEEQVQQFRSDFRYVAEYFVASRRRKEGKTPIFTITVDHLKHVEEFVELMYAVTNSDRFSALPKLIKERGGDTMMTILFDEAEARGEARGEFKKLFDQVKKKVLKNKSLEQIIDECESTEEEIRPIYDSVLKETGSIKA